MERRRSSRARVLSGVALPLPVDLLPAVGRHAGAAHAARVLDRPRLRVPLDDVQVLDDDLAVLRARVDDAALLAAVLAAEDVDEVALPDSHGVRHLEHLRG